MHPSASIDTSGLESSPLAKETLARIEEALLTGEAQCLPELVEIIHALSAKATEISVEDLADRIEKHVAVMAKVISAANTFGFNPGGAEIATLRQAIQVIGFERIRSLVTSLLLVNHAADHQDAREQKSAALMAVVSGLMAQTVGGERGLVDPEIAFVSTSLRQLGRLMMASYLPEDYRTAMGLSLGKPENIAFTEVFGLTPLALSRVILAKANFPRRLLDAMQEFDPKKAAKMSPETASLICLSDFSEKLSTLALDTMHNPADFETQAGLLSAHFGDRLVFTKEQLGGLLGFIGDRLDKFTTSLGFRGVAIDAVGALRWRSGRKNAQPPPKAKQATHVPVPPQNTLPARTADQSSPNNQYAPDSTAGEQPGPPREDSQSRTQPGPDTSQGQSKAPDEVEIKARHWRDGLMSLTTCLSDTTIDLGAVYSLALDFVRQGFGAPEAMLLKLDADLRHYIPSHGVGSVFRQIRGDRAVKKDERTVLGICITRRENVLIHNTNDAKTLSYLPGWCSQQNGWGAFVAIPLHDQGGCFALMIIAWPKPTQITLSPENSKLLRSITSTVAAAKRLSGA